MTIDDILDKQKAEMKVATLKHGINSLLNCIKINEDINNHKVDPIIIIQLTKLKEIVDM